MTLKSPNKIEIEDDSFLDANGTGYKTGPGYDLNLGASYAA